MSPPRNNVDEENTRFFSKYADKWWDIDLKCCGPLHEYNQARLPFIERGLLKCGRIDSDSFKGLKILDVGCGAGILSEPLALKGGEVVGIDPSIELIQSAKNHLKITMNDNPDIKVTYLNDLIEDHAVKYENYYDVVIASEVVEHVLDPNEFLEHCIKALKPGGSIFVTTFNRNLTTLFFAWLWGEWILGIIARGTHSWFKFVKPEEIEDCFNKNNCHKADDSGFFYTPFLEKKFLLYNFLGFQFGIQGIKNIKYQKSD
jgi:ubiquinone biosynthesis O-methyltransferase